MQDAGVVQKAHHLQQRVQPGRLLGEPGRPGPAQSRQGDLDDVGKSGLGLAASTAHPVSPPGPLTMGDHPRPEAPVGKDGQPGRVAGGLPLVGGADGGGDQQPEHPQRPAVRVHPPGDPQHGHLAQAAEPAQLLPESGPGGHPLRRLGDGPERGEQRLGGGQQERQVHVVVRAASTAVGQAGLGAQVCLLAERPDGQAGEQSRGRPCRRPAADVRRFRPRRRSATGVRRRCLRRRPVTDDGHQRITRSGTGRAGHTGLRTRR